MATKMNAGDFNPSTGGELANPNFTGLEFHTSNIPHVCFFVYDKDASDGNKHVSICRGCGNTNVTILNSAPKTFPTEVPGVWDVDNFKHSRRLRAPYVLD